VSIEQHTTPSRADRRARLQTPGFSLRRHLCAFGVLSAGAVAFAAWLARSARASDLWIVPVYLVASNVIEYLMHRLLMHRPLWPRTLYRNHTLGHHRAFHHESMEIGAWRELDLVMMPWFSLLLFFAGVAPVVAVLWSALGRGVAGLFLATAVISFVTYETMHALYHFPSGVLERLRLLQNRAFRFLYDHHRHHHRLTRMRWTNFNISIPLSDLCFGTRESEADWRAEREHRAQEAATAADQTAAAGGDDKHAA
jgi:hypothetical protein